MRVHQGQIWIHVRWCRILTTHSCTFDCPWPRSVIMGVIPCLCHAALPHTPSTTLTRNLAAGIPKFFRWIAERYPLTLCNITEDVLPVEIDNLYLDMNGIIHNCTHANQSKMTATEDQMVHQVFLYIKRLVRIAKPCQLLFMAIDGKHSSCMWCHPDQVLV